MVTNVVCTIRPEVMANLPSSSIILNSDFLDVLPAPTYANERNARNLEHLISHRNTPEADNDIFSYKITKLTEKQTQAFNSVILLNARTDGSITFSSKERSLRTVRAHCQSPLNLSDRSRYEALIHQLSSAPPLQTVIILANFIPSAPSRAPS